MSVTNQGACQSRKSAKNGSQYGLMVDFPNQELARIPKPRVGTFARRSASNPTGGPEGAQLMVSNRILPAVVSLAVLGWCAKKLRDRRLARRSPSYPSEAAPASPPSDWAASSK